jgi:hypothetical protein
MGMRQWGVQVAGAALALSAGAACATSGMGHRDYPRRDRHAMAVLIPVAGCSVIGGPETHVAFPGKKVIWRVINLCPEDVDLEIVILERHPEGAPANPFAEDLAAAVLRAPRGTARTNTFQLTIKAEGVFAAGVENQYHYRLRIKGRPDSGIDPELDIWP